MTIEVRVPQLPESVADATIVSWHKKPGDAVARDENLVDLETDKVVLEVPAPARHRRRADDALHPSANHGSPNRQFMPSFPTRENPAKHCGRRPSAPKS